VRRIVGIGGADAHARHLSPFNFIKFLSYRRTFRYLRTRLLTPVPLSPDLDESKRLIYAALESGHCFFAHDFLADSTGFNFTAFTDEGQMLLMGDEAKLRSAAELEVTSPVSADLRLLLTWKASEPGVYRVEALYNGKPWVFTNPIYLTGYSILDT